MSAMLYPASPQRANSDFLNDGSYSTAVGQSAQIHSVVRGLLHFNDEFERQHYIAHCRREREAALARWEHDGDFLDAGEADFWLLELLKMGAR